MADLLECLIQIKALAHTRDRLVQMLTSAEPAANGRGAAQAADILVQQLTALERRYVQALRPGADSAGQPPDRTADPALFAALRTANLEWLSACSADELAAAVAWPGRVFTTVADLVAVMLAGDTDAIASLREAGLGLPPR